MVILAGAVQVQRFPAGSGGSIWETRGWRLSADGWGYVDLVGARGPAIPGNARPAPIGAVRSAAVRGLLLGTPTPGEMGLAEQLVARVAPLEMVWFASNGTETTIWAIRLVPGAHGAVGHPQGRGS